MGSLLELTAAAVTGLVGWALRRYLGLKADNEIRGYIYEAASRAAKIGLQRAQEKYGHLDKVTVGNEALDIGARYMTEMVGDGIRRFNLTPEKVRDLVEARMP
ncbi:hypothetical protein P7L78_19045 [Tistrella bauzanensis]|uniref:hypothetical protein n=1 Tax=Tistrella TaxID=171436 RepID=UPI0031F69BF0